MTLPSRIRYLIFLVAAAEALSAGESDPRAVREAVGDRPGLVLQVGAVDGSLAIALAKGGPQVVAAVTADEAGAAAVRGALLRAGVHGQATAAAMNKGRLPICDWLVDVAVVESTGLVTEAELLRVVRPGGVILVRSAQGLVRSVRPRPDTIDDWPMYGRDAAGTHASRDQLVGPGRGLRWISGPQHDTSNGNLVAGEFVLVYATTTINRQADNRLVMRNAFNGMVLWERRDIVPANRYAVVLTRERLYLLSAAMGNELPGGLLVLDTATGQTLQTFDQIPDLKAELRTRSAGLDPKGISELTNALRKQVEDAMLILDESRRFLLFTVGGQAVLLDAQSGRRLWAAAPAAEGASIVWPVMANGMAILPEGVLADSLNYTHWPILTIRRVRAIGLADGRERWGYLWPQDRTSCGLINSLATAGRLVLNLRSPSERQPGGGLSGPRRPQAMLILDLATGKEHYWGTQTPFLDLQFGGHSGSRILAVGDTLWNTSIGEVIGAVRVDKPEELVVPAYNHGRPVACTSFRASPNWVFGGIAAYPVNRPDGPNPPIAYSGAARNACDVGSFPGNGLLYLTPNHCFCAPYLPGNIAFHDQPPGAPEEGERLLRGPAGPAAGPAVDGWPTMLRDSARSNWTNEALPRTLGPLWSVKPAGEAPAERLQAQWSIHFNAHGPCTGVSVGGGIAVTAANHRQAILGLDPATGRERWRTPVDGRIDSQPTIAGGLVLAGTCNGYVYALNRDNGGLIWRFRAAPRCDRIVVNGALESPWPVPGTVVVDGDSAIVVAGRHSEADGGLRWYILDLATGAVRGSGRLGRDEPLPTSNMYTDGWSARPRHPEAGKLPPPMANNIGVFADGQFLIPGVVLRRAGDTLADGSLPDGGKGVKGRFKQGWMTRHIIPGFQGLSNRFPKGLAGFMLTFYGGVSGRIFASGSEEFVAVGSSLVTSNRGGDGGDQVVRHRRLPAEEQVMGKDGKPMDALRYAEVVWQSPQDKTSGITAMLVAGDAVVVARTRPAVIDVLEFSTGAQRQRIEVSAPVVGNGLSSDDGRLFAALEDGTVLAFGGK
jgi:outer membrane protein assembly factor BamB